jgi:hypothetical protein
LLGTIIPEYNKRRLELRKEQIHRSVV